MAIFQEQKALLQAQIQGVNDRLASLQAQAQQAQIEKQALQSQLQDLKDAFQAWKGTAL